MADRSAPRHTKKTPSGYHTHNFLQLAPDNPQPQAAVRTLHYCHISDLVDTDYQFHTPLQASDKPRTPHCYNTARTDNHQRSHNYLAVVHIAQSLDCMSYHRNNQSYLRKEAYTCQTDHTPYYHHNQHFHRTLAAHIYLSLGYMSNQHNNPRLLGRAAHKHPPPDHIPDYSHSRCWYHTVVAV